MILCYYILLWFWLPFFYSKDRGVLWRVSPEYNSITHNWVEKGIINHYQGRSRHACFGISEHITSLLSYFVIESTWLFQLKFLFIVIHRKFIVIPRMINNTYSNKKLNDNHQTITYTITLQSAAWVIIESLFLINFV